MCAGDDQFDSAMGFFKYDRGLPCVGPGGSVGSTTRKKRSSSVAHLRYALILISMPCPLQVFVLPFQPLFKTVMLHS